VNSLLLEAANNADKVTATVAVLSLGLLFVAGGIAWWQLHLADKARHTEILVDLSRRWDDTLLAEARMLAATYEGRPKDLRDDILRFSQSNDPKYWTLIRVPNFFEDLGILESEGVISTALIDKTLGGACHLRLAPV
jgi:hypothetical protein